MSFWFIVSLIKRRNDVADIAWGLGFLLLSWLAFIISTTPNLRGVLVDTLVSIWGIRLALHIYARNRGKAEDYRYLEWRKTWGKWFYLHSYTQIYLLQGTFLFLIILPVLLINKSSSSILGIIDFTGILIWIFGFCFEAIGDFQLKKFMKNPLNKGRIMQDGLWRYTRHPNYFGEVTQWWGIWMIAINVPYGWVSIVCPITITILILKVSGIPLLEKKMAENPEFADYKRRTSMLIPFFPKI